MLQVTVQVRYVLIVRMYVNLVYVHMYSVCNRANSEVDLCTQ